MGYINTSFMYKAVCSWVNMVPIITEDVGQDNEVYNNLTYTELACSCISKIAWSAKQRTVGNRTKRFLPLLANLDGITKFLD